MRLSRPVRRLRKGLGYQRGSARKVHARFLEATLLPVRLTTPTKRKGGVWIHLDRPREVGDRFLEATLLPVRLAPATHRPAQLWIQLGCPLEVGDRFLEATLLPVSLTRVRL